MCGIKWEDQADENSQRRETYDAMHKTTESERKATKIRQDEHSEFATVKANNAATSKLLGLAIIRLNKFYALALHKAAPKVELIAEDRVYVNLGGEISTAAPMGNAQTDVPRLQLLQEPVVEPHTSKFEKKTEVILEWWYS